MRSDREVLAEAYQGVLAAIQERGWSSPADLQNMHGTDSRAAKAMLEMVKPKGWIDLQVEEILGVKFPVRGDSLVRQVGLTASMMCPHHLLPVMCSVEVEYQVLAWDGAQRALQRGAIGLSKVQRLASVLGKGPVLQEDYTTDLAAALARVGGYAWVQTTALHTCMACRGIEAPEIRTICTTQTGTRHGQKG